MDYDLLEEQIRYRFFRCNEMTPKQADDYAAIAINELKNHMGFIADNSDKKAA